MEPVDLNTEMATGRFRSPVANYSRSPVGSADFRRVMEGRGWVSVETIASLLWDKIPPETALRTIRLNRKVVAFSESEIACGKRRVIATRLGTLMTNFTSRPSRGATPAWLERKVENGTTYYRLIEPSQ